MKWRLVGQGVLAFGFLVVLGCGASSPALHPVTGHLVFRDGKPVAGAVIEFVSESGLSARGKTAADGAFELTTGDRKGTVAGMHRIAVVHMLITDGAVMHLKSHHAAMVVHPKYARFDTSELSREVKAGSNEFTIEVVPAAENKPSSGWGKP